MGQLTTFLLFIELFPKKYANMDEKVNQRQNTVGLEQQIYASPDNFTPTLLVMLETFRMSGATIHLLLSIGDPLLRSY